jgi:multiple sugar transport system permease protein
VRSASTPYRNWTFVAFPLAIVMVFTAVPTLFGVGLSLFEWSGGGSVRFIGVQNYEQALGDDTFWHALRNTLIFAVVSVPLTVVLAFPIAVALHAPWFLGRTFMRTCYFLPTIVSIVAIGLIWRWVLEPSNAGLLNHLIDKVVKWVDVPYAMGWSATAFHVKRPDWLGNSPWGLATITIVSIWRGLGFSVVLYLAAVGQVPRSLYDAAAVDGATSWQTMWRVTWPSVRPMTFFLLITGMITALQVFDIVYVMIGQLEQSWTDVLNLYLYREFIASRLGYAATLGVFVLTATILVTLAQVWLLKREGRV